MTINTFPIQTIDAATIVTQIETAKTDTQAARDAALQALADAEQIVEDLTSEPFEISDTAGLQAALDAKASASALATVATSGSYDDLLDVPPAFSGAYDDLSGIPSTFAPAAHTTGSHSDWPAGVSMIEVGYLDGVTSAIQTQINNKAATSHTHSLSDLPDASALSVTGRSANSSGVRADIAAASDYQVMRRSGTSIGFGAINLASSAAVTGTLPIANGGSGTMGQRAVTISTSNPSGGVNGDFWAKV